MAAVILDQNLEYGSVSFKGTDLARELRYEVKSHIHHSQSACICTAGALSPPDSSLSHDA
eukprot:1337974-Amorphochlora_amoeboformis.AAC.2